jgi:hypothetical protein
VSATQANADSINAYNQRLMALRYSKCTNGDAKYVDAVKDLRPDFRMHKYNSFQDNYVTASGDEHTFLKNECAKRGVSIETMYLHYWDATQINLQGTTLYFPGLANARTNADSVNSRIPVYYSDRSRIVVNYSNPLTRQLEKKYACIQLSTLPTQGSYYTASSGTTPRPPSGTGGRSSAAATWPRNRPTRASTRSVTAGPTGGTPPT